MRSLLICAKIDELPNEMGQPVAWTEPVVLMLIDVRWAHFCSPVQKKVFVELPEEAGTDKSKVGLLLRSMYGCRDAGVNWEFAICEVMIAIGFVQWQSVTLHLPTSGEAAPCMGTWRRLCSSRYILNVRWFFVKLQEFWVVTSRGIFGPPWIPRLCAKHSSAGQDRGMDC